MTAPTARVRAAMLERDGHRCVSCGTTQNLEAQHRQAVGFGGSKIAPTITQLVAACSADNAAFEHSLQALALLRGWKVRRWVTDCALVPVYYPVERAWYQLDAEGGRSRLSWDAAIELMVAVYGAGYENGLR